MMRGKIIIGVILVVILVFFFGIYKPNRWSSYYKEKLQHAPRQFVIDALASLPKAPQGSYALDLGSGVGHEAFLLAEKGFKVIAIDSQKEAFDYMRKLPQFKRYESYISPIISTFESLDFSNKPLFDVIVASYSLPFMRQEESYSFFFKLVAQLKKGGYFIGNFFDPRFNVFKKADRENMSFHTKEQVDEFFADFKVITFKENTSREKDKIDYTYEVFAQKI